MSVMMLLSASRFSGSGGNGFAGGKSRCRLILYSSFCVLVCIASSRGQALSTGEITTAHELKNLPATEASAGRQVRLKGLVVCYDSGWNQLYVCDGQETVYLNPHNFQNQPDIGQQVEITGRTAGDGALSNANLTVLGTGRLPDARRLGLSQLGTNWCEWIETTGRVLSAENSLGRPALMLYAEEQNCLVYVLGAASSMNDFRHLLNCKVRIRGINASKTSGGRLESASVFVPGMNQIEILEPAGKRPSPIPVVSIGGLLNRELGPWTNSMVHVNGLIVSYQPGQSLVVKDPTGVIRARIIQLTQISADERVDVWGFWEVSSNETFLKNAYFEVVAPSAQNSPVISAASSVVDSIKSHAELTQISQILKLKPDEASAHFPVRLRGVITFADPEWHNGFLQDKGDAVYVDLDQNGVQSGQWVEITGRTSPGGFAPEVISSLTQVIGPTNLPTPAKVDLEDLANGHFDAHWVAMEGVVWRVEVQSGHVHLTLMTPKGRFKAIIPDFYNKPAPTHLIDALVSVQGACTSELNVRQQLSGITLHVPSLNQIKVLEPAAADPFAVGSTRIEAVATFDPDHLAGRRVKVHGIVTMRLPGEGFILEDASGGMRILTRQTNEVRMGDLVDVLGFPAIGDFSPQLEEASFRNVGTGPLPAPKKTTAEQILLHGSNDCLVVQVTARLLQGVPRSSNPQLVLQDGPIIFMAHLGTQTRGREIPDLQSGSLLRLTGVCSIKGGEAHEPETFGLLLRHPEDVVLVQSAPWWTARHTITLLGGMMVLVAAALAWVRLLRRQVRHQTEIISQKLQVEATLKERYLDLFENANDMVYTHDLQGRITSINEAGERLLQRRREAILSRNILELVVEEQRAAARHWLEQVLNGAEPPTAEWDFTGPAGQRVKLEISARLIHQNGQVVEVEGIARDITERKRLEREILEISNREQRRIGHDLHDGVCQQLAGIAYMTASLTDSLQEKGAEEFSQAERIGSLLNAVMNQTRGVARGLFPVRLEENGLASALEELATNASELFKVSCRFVADQPPEAVDNGIALHLYYIALEAVANAAKHGKSGNIVIGLAPAGDRYELSIRDDGIGFHTSSNSSGMGIRIMRYRARVIGATLSLQSQPGSGTHVICQFLSVSHEPVADAKNGETGMDEAQGREPVKVSL